MYSKVRGNGRVCEMITLSFIVIVSRGLVSGKLLAGFAMPHGGIALDPSHFNTTNATSRAEASALHKACVSVGKQINELDPDLIILTTPHGVSDLRNFVFYLNPKGYGFGDTDNCQCPPCCYNVSVNMNVNISQELVTLFGYERNVSGLSAYGPPGGSSEPFPLRWGEVIPLHFVSQGGTLKSPVVILSLPSRRYTDQVNMIPELLKIGGDLSSYLDGLEEKVVVISSGDLAHTHLSDGPYGYSNASEPFDQAVGKWAESLDEHALLDTAAGLVDRALSCGYPGLVMLHGMFVTKGLSSWQPELLVNYHPSYYGMMVAAFTRKDSVAVFGN